MSTGLVPIAVEVVTTLLFCGILVYLRKSMTPKTVAFWILLWVARGAVSLGAMFIPATARFLENPTILAALMGALALIAVSLLTPRNQFSFADMAQGQARERQAFEGESPDQGGGRGLI